MKMNNLARNIYSGSLKTSALLVILGFILFPFNSYLKLSILTLNNLLLLAFLFFIIIGFGVLLSIINLKAKKLIIFTAITNYLLYKICYPIIHKLFNTQSLSYQKYATLLVKYNNILQKKQVKKFKASEVLILLPHCLQFASCPHKITYDIDNCVECGKCVIADFKALKQEYGVTIKVATGGTLARKIISDTKPKVIIAVACHRDLTEGIKDIEVIPVVGVLNERPNGPCFNTTCDIAKIKEVLDKIL